MNRFFGRTLLSSLVVSSLVAFAGIAHAEGGAGGEAGAAGAAAGSGGAAAGAGGAAAGAGGAAAGAGGAAAGAAGSSAAGSGGAPATTCVGVTEADLKPLTACADATAGAAAFFCTAGACTPKGESCKTIYEACKADAGCEKAVYCGGLCAAGEDSVSNCVKFAGTGVTLALKVKDCQAEAAKAVADRSACGTAGSGGSEAGGSGGSGTAGSGTAGSGTAGSGTAGSGTAGAGGTTAKPAATPPAEEDDGCGCSVPGASHSSQAAGLVGLGLLALGLRRRKNAKLDRGREAPSQQSGWASFVCSDSI